MTATLNIAAKNIRNMALNFKIEAKEKRLIIHVKGNVIELSYHAASCLCRCIIEACTQRIEFHRYAYWVEKYKQNRKVKVRPHNKKIYDDFLASKENSENLMPSLLGKSRVKKHKSEDERRAAMQAKIKELQERHHITQRKRQNDDENS